VWTREDHAADNASGATPLQPVEVHVPDIRYSQPSCAAAADSTKVAKRGKTVVVSEAISSTQYRGTIKYFRGTYGWVQCAEVAKMYPNVDIFLHINDCDFRPRQWDRVVCELALDDNGNPKAVKASLQCH